MAVNSKRRKYREPGSTADLQGLEGLLDKEMNRRPPSRWSQEAFARDSWLSGFRLGYIPGIYLYLVYIYTCCSIPGIYLYLVYIYTCAQTRVQVSRLPFAAAISLEKLKEVKEERKKKIKNIYESWVRNGRRAKICVAFVSRCLVQCSLVLLMRSIGF